MQSEEVRMQNVMKMKLALTLTDLETGASPERLRLRSPQEREQLAVVARCFERHGSMWQYKEFNYETSDV